MSVNTYFFRHLNDYLLRVPANKLLVEEMVPSSKLLISEWASELLIVGRILDYNMFLSEVKIRAQNNFFGVDGLVAGEMENKAIFQLFILRLLFFF